jgi:hypothetical protein
MLQVGTTGIEEEELPVYVYIPSYVYVWPKWDTRAGYKTDERRHSG